MPNSLRLEVINTGTELLLGSVVNSHLAYIGKHLLPIGLRVARQDCVPDGDAIREAIAEAFSRADIILVTGGLGPTTDDLTRECTAELLGLALFLDSSVENAIRTRFAGRGIQITDRILRQAMAPEGATVLPNPNGTAPGLYLPPTAGKTAHPHLFLLPGPPRELRPMFENIVLPILKSITGEPTEISRTFHVAGVGESQVEALVGEKILAIPGIELGYCARPGEVDLRLVGAPEAVAAASEIALEFLSQHIYGEEDTTMESAVVAALARNGKTVATAESCTGGLLANRITDVPGASAVYLGGFVPYSNEAKTAAVGVPAELIAEHGAVSEPVARALAEGARERTGSDYALATTGIAGPGGGTPEKPVGTVYIALAGSGFSTQVERHSFKFDRETFKFITTRVALNMLRLKLPRT